jgi:hypothetical protein
VIRCIAAAAFAVAIAVPGTVSAKPFSLKAVLSPKQEIRGDLPTTPPHFVLFVRREGRASGTGLLDGAEVTEYGMPDIRPGLDGAPRGYLVAKLPTGDQAVVQWEVAGHVHPGARREAQAARQRRVALHRRNRGLKGIRGAGTMHIQAVSLSDREFQLEGRVVVAKE